MKTKLNNTIDLPKTSALLILDATDVFTGWIDSDFKNYKLTSSESRNKRTMEIHDLTEDATFKQIFDSFDRKLDDMVVSQGQVIEFTKTLKKDNGYDHLFLLKNLDGEFFVADVHFHSDGHLEVYVHRLSYDYVWHAEYRPRIVVPQLATSSLSFDPLNPRPFESLEKRVADLEEFRKKVESFLILK